MTLAISRRIATFAVLGLAFAAAGCGKPEPLTATAEAPPPPPPAALPTPPPPAPAASGDVVTVDNGADGTEIHAHPGQKLVLRLSGESGSTGYRWKLVSGAGHHLVQIARTYEASATAPNAGGVGTAVYTFALQQPGKADLKLALLPPGRGRRADHAFILHIDIDHP